MDWQGVIVQLIIAVTTITVTVLGLRKMRAEAKKLAAEVETEEVTAADRITDTALKLVEPLKMRIVELESTVASLRERLNKAENMFQRVRQQNIVLYEGVCILSEQLKGKRIEPAWVPPKELAELKTEADAVREAEDDESEGR